MAKAASADVSRITDHDLHSRAVALCSQHNTSSKLLQKALDHRHETVIKRFAWLQGEVAVMQEELAALLPPARQALAAATQLRPRLVPGCVG